MVILLLGLAVAAWLVLHTETKPKGVTKVFIDEKLVATTPTTAFEVPTKGVETTVVYDKKEFTIIKEHEVKGRKLRK